MELREFAESVLFATTLEEKLSSPDVVTDETPGAALFAPEAPGRPAELRFRKQDAPRADFPGTERLEQQRERGRLLHFFANHELLATELMALALLRFPEAPPAFRRGVLQTLRDEQQHTRLYIERMRQCAIEFGELPVSGYFWRAVSRMESPIDYVAGLSLTFEQANLDFARHFSRSFTALGDDTTAALLEKIYRDEIAHVAYGLKWFRRWKNPSESDWDAFCRQLKFPLSPQRAKGFALNIEGRRAAGLDPQFIAALDVYSQSKGRTPNVFFFNPFAEARIAHGKSFTPVKHQSQLALDLANLPQFLCRADDIVLVPKRPSVEFLSGIKQAGFPLPEFVELQNGRISSTNAVPQRRIGKLRPWAWGPDSVEILQPIFANVTVGQRSATEYFNPDTAHLYSKSWSANFLAKFLSQRSQESWLCTQEEVGVTVSTLDEALEAIAGIRARGHHKVVVKESIGLAGHNSIRLWEPHLLEAQRRWMASVTENRRQLVIEPWLERVLDFSLQLEMNARGLTLCGFTGLINDRKGQFQANSAAPGFERRVPLAVTGAFARGPRDISMRVQALFEEIFSLLELELRRIGYAGPLGVDAFVYRTSTGKRCLKPIVEINPRYTMGRVLVELMHRTCPGSYGLFRLVNRTALRAAGAEDFPGYARNLIQQHPLKLEGEPVPRIREGAVCLNDPLEARVCLATFQVGRQPPEFGAALPIASSSSQRA